MTTAVDDEGDNQLWQGRGHVELHPELGSVQLVGNPPEMTISGPAMTTTDGDLRDLLQRAGMSAEEIERILANSYVTTYAKSLMDIAYKFVAEQVAQRLIEKIFTGDDEFAVELRQRLNL